MMAGKLGRLLVSVFGSVLVAVVFNASPGVPPYGLAAAHPAQGMNSLAAGESLAVGSNNSPQPSSQAGPGTRIPPFKCPVTESPAGVCAPCIPLAGNNQPTRFCLPCKPITTEAPLPRIGCPSSSPPAPPAPNPTIDRKSTRLNSSHLGISYAVFCLKKK